MVVMLARTTRYCHYFSWRTVVSTSISDGGDKFDESHLLDIQKEANIMIRERTAEDLKVSIGNGFPKTQEVSMDIRGRNLALPPKTITVTSTELMDALEEPVYSVVEAVHRCWRELLPSWLQI